MIFPILFIVGLALVGMKLGEKMKGSDLGVGAIVDHRRPTPKQVPAPRPRTYYRDILGRTVAGGHEPSRHLVTCAMEEAVRDKDWEAVTLLSQLFDRLPVPETREPTPAPEEQPPVPELSESPIADVSDEDWSEFSRVLATRDPAFSTERHHGMFEHNRNRLKQLGVGTPEGPGAQLAALAADMGDYWASEHKLIADYQGEAISIPGKANPESQDGLWPVTASGILGLLKAAGPKGARSWLDNESDRGKFPHTTETFLNTNGVF